MSLPWTCEQPLSREQYSHGMRRAIFDCCKWHTQVKDGKVVCAFPLVLDEATWSHLAGLAAALATETLAAERELLDRFAADCPPV